MSGPSALGHAALGSRGAVLVLVALMMPVIIGFGGLVVDVGNWFGHKRHLQVEADAGVLAAASQFQACVGPSPSSTAIVTAAGQYSSVFQYSAPGYVPSGYTPPGGPGYNPQIGGTAAANLYSEINSQTYYNQPSSPVDNTVVQGDPCAAKMLDLKLTETDLPWYLKLAKVPFINAQARVEIRQQTTATKALPIGVPDVGPRKVHALFVNEATGAIISETDLVRTGTGAGGIALWDNSAVPAAVPVNTSDIGVRIVLSQSTSTTCGTALVDCYGAGTSPTIVAGAPGLVHVRGWSGTPAGAATAPQARDASLFAGSCEDGYFTAIAATYPCNVNISATVDFGSSPPPLATTRVFALLTGAKTNTEVALTAPATSTGSWKGGALQVGSVPGAVSVALRWGTGCTTSLETSCAASGTLGTVQRTFAGSESLSVSGPIKLLRLSENGAPGANSFPICAACAPHSLVVTLGLKPSLQNAQTVGDPIVTLKVASGSSQNQALDCDPAVANLRDQIAQGCGPQYAVNTGQTCPAKTTLWAGPQPWNCVVIATGAKVGEVTQGMNLRILGSTSAAAGCIAPNHWYTSFPNFAPGDPRIVSVFLTPFGAFTGSGGTTVPVTGFATFYVTGWDNGGCQGKGDDPAGQGEVVGHFIKYINTLGGAGQAVCDFSSVGSCVALLTR